MRARWRDPGLVLGVAVIALCSVLGARLLARADDTVEVWAARSALGAGQPVAATDLVRRPIRFGDQADADRYLSADSDVPAGTTLDRPVGAGELVPRAALVERAAASLTEVPLSVRTEAVPVTVRVGSTVDVWVTPEAVASGAEPGRSRTPSTRVFDEVPVLALPGTGEALGPAATRQVIVGVGEDDGRLLARSIAALAGGDVILTVQR